MSESLNPPVYQIEAWWPDTRTPPDRDYRAHYADLISRVIDMANSGQYTTVLGRTPDGLVLIQMWGQLKGFP